MANQLTNDNVLIRITNWVEGGGQKMIDRLPYSVLKVSPRNWRLVSNPVQVNVNDRQHSAPLVTNCEEYVSSDWMWQLPEGFTPWEVEYDFLGGAYTALYSNGRPVNPADTIIGSVKPTIQTPIDQDARQQWAHMHAVDKTYMGTFFIQFTLIVRELTESGAELEAVLAEARTRLPSGAIAQLTPA